MCIRGARHGLWKTIVLRTRTKHVTTSMQRGNQAVLYIFCPGMYVQDRLRQVQYNSKGTV